MVRVIQNAVVSAVIHLVFAHGSNCQADSTCGGKHNLIEVFNVGGQTEIGREILVITAAQHFHVAINDGNVERHLKIVIVIDGWELTVRRVQMNVVLLAGNAEEIVHSESLHFDCDLNAIDIRIGNTKSMAIVYEDRIA